MKHLFTTWSLLVFFFITSNIFSQAIIIDHNCAKLEPIPESAVINAKQTLHIAYGHTSHGSQLTDGMTGLIGQTNLIGYKGDIYNWNNGGTDNALDLHDYFGSGDLGHNGDTTWAPYTRTYLATNPDVNVIIYSWCGGCSDNSYDGIQTYLDKMNELEQDYPNVQFVYMTGHTDIWADETLKANNQHIRDYCNAHNKILFDFADIERYDPDGTYFEFATDNCNYYSDGTGSTLLGNWATEWQSSHTEGIDWYNCSAAHSEALNGNLKAYAAWWLWCRLSGWEGVAGTDETKIEDALNVYPNPAKNEITIKINVNTNSEVNLSIFDIAGKKIDERNFVENYSDNNVIEINTQQFKSGIYFINIETGNERYTEKFTIVK